MQIATPLETIDCPCCGRTPNRVWVDEGRGTQYRACRNCGTVFASPRVRREARTAAFTVGWGKETALRIAKLREVALRKVAASIQLHKRSGRLLDCGCSSGALFQHFDKALWELHGVELAPTAAAYATETAGAIVHTGTLESAKYPPNHFDLVTIIDAFYYFDDPACQLMEVARVLKHDGVLGIEIPGGKYSKVRSLGLLCLVLNRRWYRLASDSHYLFIYTAKGFRKLVEGAGFTFVGLEAIPSPQTSLIANLLNGMHFWLARKLLPHFPCLVDWSPKVLWIFRKNDQNVKRRAA